MSAAHEERFRTLYAAHFRDLLGFALRRTPTPEEAADVVADTFLVAWRRMSTVPEGAEARLWLYGTCRRVLANADRARTRRDRLGARLASTLASTLAAQAAPDPATEVPTALVVRDALTRLAPSDRELLQLTAWEGLQPHEVAVVLDLPARTVRTRLFRARARLRDALPADLWPDGDAEDPAGHVEEEPLTSKDLR